MPNWVKHSMEIRGKKAIVDKCVAAIGRDVERKVRTTHDGATICKKKGGKEFNVGWYDEETGNFSIRDNGIKTIQESGNLPDEWGREYVEAHRVWIDFNRIVPFPDYLFTGGLGMKDEEENPGRNWLNWNRRRWGTKWGAADTDRDSEGRIIFETAWSVPKPVLEELSMLFPELTFHVIAIDEGWNFAGVWVFENGGCTESNIECSSKNETFRDMHKRLYGDYPEDE